MTAATPIPVVIEARHVRLTNVHVEVLFGAGHALLSLVPLQHTGRFAAADVVELRGPGGALRNVRVLGPNVHATAVLVSEDDLQLLGFRADASATCAIIGPKGTVVLAGSVLRSLRRLVVTAEMARALGPSVDVVVNAERARELRAVPVEVAAASAYASADASAAQIGVGAYLGIDVTDANAMDVGPSTRARITSSPATWSAASSAASSE